MLRLRTYEKLQHFVQTGLVKKIGKEYRGIHASLENFIANAAEAAKLQIVRPPAKPATA